MALIQFTGLASGIDSKALIEATLDQRRKSRVEPLQARVTAFQDTNSAYSELSSLLESLRTKASQFRAVNGGGLFKQATSSDETKVSASASNSATPGTYTVTVNQLAKNGSGFIYSNSNYTSGSDVINGAINNGAPAVDRTVDVTVGQGAEQFTASVELTNTTTLQGLVDSLNSEFASNGGKASASLINVGTSAAPNYRVFVSSSNQGEEEGYLDFVIGTEITTAGAGAFQNEPISQATNAELSIDGISGTIERQSNTITDVITGVSFNLQATGSAAITVTPDPDQTISALQDFVDAYNEVVSFIKENDLVTQEKGEDNSTISIFGPLSTTSLDDNILSALRSALGNSSISGGTLNILADLGVTTNRDGTLSFDSDDFKEAVSDGPTDVQSILENLGEQFGATGGTIDQFTRFNGLIDLNERANESQISSLQNRIDDIEKQLGSEEQRLTAQFARLESLIGGLQSQQSALSSVISGIK